MNSATDDPMKNPFGKIDNGSTMSEMWDGFRTLVLPDVGVFQTTEMQKGFYAGALCLFNWFMIQMDEDREPTEDDLIKVSNMEKEIQEFFLRNVQHDGPLS